MSDKPEGLDQFLKGSNRPAGLDEFIAPEVNEEKYGGVKGSLTAGALGLASGLTGSLSDVALTKTGIVAPETLKGYEEENPASHMTGEIASFFSPEGFAAGVGKAGKATVGGLKALRAVKAAEEASTAARVLTEVGVHAAGAAVEGGIYGGTSQSLNEYALGDPSLNGEKVLANFGYGALLGGVAGGVLKGAEIGIPASLRAAQDGLVKVRNTLIGAGEGGSAGILGDMLPEHLSEAWASRAVNLGVDQRASLISDVSKDLSAVQNNVETSLTKLNKEIRPAETEALIGTADDRLVKTAATDVMREMKAAVDVMRMEPELYSGYATRKLELQYDGFVRKITKDTSPKALFNSMRETKQLLQDMVKTNLPTIQEKESMKILDSLQKSFNQKLHDSTIFGEAGSALASHDEMLSKYYSFVSPKKPTEFQKSFMTKAARGRWEFDPKKVERAFKTAGTITGESKIKLLDEYYQTIKSMPDHLEKTYQNVPNKRFEKDQLKTILNNQKMNPKEASEKYMSAVQNSKNKLGLGEYTAANIATQMPVLGGIVQAYNVYANPIGAINKMAELERIVGKTTRLVNKGAKAIFDPSLKGLNKIKSIGVRESSAERVERHKLIAGEIARSTHGEVALMEKLADGIDPLSEVAPDMSAALGMSTAKAMKFLSSKIPIGMHDSNPFESAYEPSNAEISRFERYHNIVENPISALDQVASNTITPETVETLSFVYPKLYDEMKQSVLERAAEQVQGGDQIPFQTRQSLSLFLGEPLTPAFEPNSIMQNQMAFMAGAPPPNQTKGSSEAKSDMTLAQRTGLGNEEDDT